MINENENKSSKLIMRIAYAYLALPFLIFVGGWCKIYISVPVISIVLVALFLAFRDIQSPELPKFRKKDISKIVIVAILAFIWVYFSGIGGFAFQNYDHSYRNDMFRLLVEKKWPVILSNPAPYYNKPVGLVFYFAFWLPSALAGKIFGLNIGILFQPLWAFIGVMMVKLNICLCHICFLSFLNF